VGDAAGQGHLAERALLISGLGAERAGEHHRADDGGENCR
jgi:hypothetical protein